MADSLNIGSLSPADKAYVLKIMQANPGATIKDAIEAINEQNVVPGGGSDFVRQAGSALRGAHQDVNKVLNWGRIPGVHDGGMIPTESLNPIPSSAGDAASLAASVAANLATRGQAGVLPSLARVGAPVAAGAVGDVASGDNDDAAVNAILRSVATGGPEVVAGTMGTIKRFRGAVRLQPGDIERTTGAINDATRGIRPVQPNTADIVRAGEGKPGMGNPAASGSLEAALNQEFKRTIDVATRVAGNHRVRFALPNGQYGSLQEALDAYAGLREGAAIPGAVAGGEKAQAERLFDHIIQQLRAQPDTDLQLVSGMLQQGRQNLAHGMSAQRLIADARTGTTIGSKSLEPIVSGDSGRLDQAALMNRFHALADAGLIDPAVRDQFETALKRGYSGPLTDQPGKMPLSIRPRVTAGGGASVAENIGELLKTRLPRFVGTPGNLGPIAPIQGAPRQIMSIGGLATEQDARERLRNAPTP